MMDAIDLILTLKVLLTFKQFNFKVAGQAKTQLLHTPR